MRTFAAAFVFSVLIGANSVEAAERSNLAKAGFRGTTDVCLNETISFEKGILRVVSSKTSAAYTNCKKENPANTCVLGKNNYGVVSFSGSTDTKDDMKCEISKCDPKYKDKLEQCIKSAGIVSRTPIDLDDPVEARRQVANLDMSSAADRQELTRVLQDLGVEGATDSIVKDDPDAAKDLVDKILNNDKEGAEEAARKLGLNDDLRDVRYLRSEGEDDVIPKEAEPTAGTMTDNTFTTKDPQMELAKKAIATIESGGRYYLIGPCSKGDCPYGKYQVMGRNVRAWSCEMGQCMTPQQFLNCPDCQERVFEYKFGQYVQKYGYEGAARAWFAGEGGMWRNSRDILGTSVSSYAAKFNALFNGTAMPRLASNPYQQVAYQNPSPLASVNPFQAQSAPSQYFPPPSYPASPFAAQQSPQMAPQPAPVSSTLGSPSGQVQASTPSQQAQDLRSALQKPGTSATSEGAAGKGEPALSLFAQPREVKRGNSIVVSWTTVGMNANACSVYVQSGGERELFARDKEGSRTVRTSATSPTGTWTFSLQCTATSGSAQERETSVLVQ